MIPEDGKRDKVKAATRTGRSMGEQILVLVLAATALLLFLAL